MAKSKREEVIKDVTGDDIELKAYSFEDNLPKYTEMVGYFRWYPDLFLDLIKPSTGGINLHLDQRIFLRSLFRFQSFYGVFSRSFGKSFLQVLALVLTAIMFPNVDLTLTAQTKQNASKLLHDKWKEIERYYPMLKNELAEKPRFSKDEALILFLNGSRIDILANSQTSKGQRRHRMSIEESALMDANLFDDALAPVVDNPRRTAGKYGIVNPQELHRQINFFTTSWFRASYEYSRMRQMVDEMVNLSGSLVLGASWQLSAWYGRGADKATIKRKREKENPVTFDMNYCSRWVGVTEGALIDIQKFLDLRTLKTPMFDNQNEEELYMGVDVARSDKDGNCQTIILVGRVLRFRNGTIDRVQCVNMFTVDSKLSFVGQAREVKKTFSRFKCIAAVVDANGLGKGLTDELLQHDPDYGAWGTINGGVDGEDPEAPRVMFALKASESESSNSDIITNFIGMVSNSRLELLISESSASIAAKDIELLPEDIVPFVHTDFLIGEVSNLQLVIAPNGKITVKQVIQRLGKDRYSALIYMLWYIMKYKAGFAQEEPDDEDIMGFARFF